MDVGTSREAGMPGATRQDVAQQQNATCRSAVPGAIRGEDAAPTGAGALYRAQARFSGTGYNQQT
jgi:hypothetical protein